jgi:hypothetical protein
MSRVLAKSFMVSAAVLAMPVATTPHPHDAPRTYQDDPRLAKLKAMFHRLQAPAIAIAEEFLIAADRHRLDWRLLPSIALIESGGGRDCRGHNLFGWDGGAKAFPSPRYAVHAVADRLANSKLYRNKNVDQLLATYNPNEDYPARVKRVMRRLDAPVSSRN